MDCCDVDGLWKTLGAAAEQAGQLLEQSAIEAVLQGREERKGGLFVKELTDEYGASADARISHFSTMVRGLGEATTRRYPPAVFQTGKRSVAARVSDYTGGMGLEGFRKAGSSSPTTTWLIRLTRGCPVRLPMATSLLSRVDSMM
jgi:hypothetical protein